MPWDLETAIFHLCRCLVKDNIVNQICQVMVEMNLSLKWRGERGLGSSLLWILC